MAGGLGEWRRERSKDQTLLEQMAEEQGCAEHSSERRRRTRTTASQGPGAMTWTSTGALKLLTTVSSMSVTCVAGLPPASTHRRQPSSITHAACLT